MIFGKIEYLNLLPFHLFLKSHIRSSQIKAILHRKKGVPSSINRAFKKRQIDGAIISSITSRGCSCGTLGIVAKKEVQSVLLLPGEKRDDIESATSNILAKVLNLEGEVLIGDKALRHYIEHNSGVDLAKEWHNRYRLPFVFARLCFHKNSSYYKKLERGFLKRKNINIPHYIIEKASVRSNIPIKSIKKYLKHITYHIEIKEFRSLKKFWKLSKKQEYNRSKS